MLLFWAVVSGVAVIGLALLWLGRRLRGTTGLPTGQVVYNATRQLVLHGVDGVVFVADSQFERLGENLACLHGVESGLRQLGTSLAAVPTVFQYNKRDLPNAAPTRHLDAALNPKEPGFPTFEASANQGIRVFETLNAISQMVLHHFHSTSEARGSTAPPNTRVPTSEGLAKAG